MRYSGHGETLGKLLSARYSNPCNLLGSAGHCGHILIGVMNRQRHIGRYIILMSYLISHICITKV